MINNYENYIIQKIEQRFEICFYNKFNKSYFFVTSNLNRLGRNRAATRFVDDYFGVGWSITIYHVVGEESEEILRKKRWNNEY